MNLGRLGLILAVSFATGCAAGSYQLAVHQYAFAGDRGPNCALAIVPATGYDLATGTTPDGKYKVIGRLEASNLTDPNPESETNLAPVRAHACAMGGSALAITAQQKTDSYATTASATYAVLIATDPASASASAPATAATGTP